MTNVIEINQDEFLNSVIEKSKETPVLVDFWAPWCGPCKQLTPLLEKIVNDKNGKVILVKINVDENQQIAGQLNVRSIPTVYGFVDGKPIDAFQGVQPESKILEMVNKMIEASPGNELPKLLEEASVLFQSQKFQEALSIYEKSIVLDPGNPKVISGMLRCLYQLQKIDDAKEVLDSLDEKILENEEIKKIITLLDKTHKLDDSSTIQELEKQILENPSNKEIRYDLAVNYLAINKTEQGFEELLILFEQDSKWNEEAAKKKLLEQFDLLGFNDLNVINARKKLSSLMFK